MFDCDALIVKRATVSSNVLLNARPIARSLVLGGHISLVYYSDCVRAGISYVAL